MSEEICEVIITAPEPTWLTDFVRQLVEDRLCAGSHTSAEVRSIYRWQGEVFDRSEARVALHTRLTLVPLIVDRANHEHPYEVPCVVAVPMVAGNPAYMQWVLDETTAPAET